MKKTRLVLMLIILCTFIFSSCSILGVGSTDKDMSAYEKIQKQLTSLETYTAEATVEYVNNKGSNSYETLQYGKISGEYRIEITGPERVAGNVTLSDGKSIGQYNPKIAGKISVTSTESRDRLEVLFTTFLKNYMKSQEVSINVSTIDESRCTVFEAVIPGEHPYLSMERLWVDNETLKPVKLVIYDPDGSERVIVTYKKFEYNSNLADELFKIQQ